MNGSTDVSSTFARAASGVTLLESTTSYGCRRAFWPVKECEREPADGKGQLRGQRDIRVALGYLADTTVLFFKYEDGHRCDLGADMVGNHTENMLHEKAGVQGYLDNGNAFTRESTSWLTNHQLHEKTACVRELW